MVASQEARLRLISLGEVSVLTPSDGTPAQGGDDHLACRPTEATGKDSSIECGQGP